MRAIRPTWRFIRSTRADSSHPEPAAQPPGSDREPGLSDRCFHTIPANWRSYFSRLSPILSVRAEEVVAVVAARAVGAGAAAVEVVAARAEAAVAQAVAVAAG